MEEAGGRGDLVGTGLLLSPAVLSMSPMTKRAAPGQKATKKKAKRETRGFKSRL